MSKLAQEMVALRAAEHDGLDVIVARAFNHIGPRQSPAFVASSLAKQIALIETGRLEPTLFVGNLDPRRDLTDVRDMVRAYRALVDRGTRGLAYNVCRGEALSVRELIDALVARARVPVNVVVDPERVRKVDIPLVLGSHARLTSDTGWQPEVPFAPHARRPAGVLARAGPFMAEAELRRLRTLTVPMRPGATVPLSPRA